VYVSKLKHGIIHSNNRQNMFFGREPRGDRSYLAVGTVWMFSDITRAVLIARITVLHTSKSITFVTNQQ